MESPTVLLDSTHRVTLNGQNQGLSNFKRLSLGKKQSSGI